MYSAEVLFFGSFALFVFVMLAIDLGVFNKKNHIIKTKEALVMSAIWLCFAICFYILLLFKGHWIHGINDLASLQAIITVNHQSIAIIPTNFTASLTNYNQNLALEFMSGYLVEYALSVDNIFVIILLLTAFNVAEKYYHRVLFWGILGAILMRFLFIFIGASLIKEFEWILYLFGIFLLYTGLTLFFKKEETEKIDTENHPVVKFFAKYFKVFPRYVGSKFFVKKNKKWLITPLFIVLIVIEFSDLIFAVDSIPAIFSITKDPFVVFFSNIFAILGLRSMFFLLVNVIHQFHYLKTGLAVLLTFIGVKMLAAHWLKAIGFGTLHSLLFIIFVLLSSILMSTFFPKTIEK
jgi:tellurite resistance protein TerC